jgi:hypothetical protein
MAVCVRRAWLLVVVLGAGAILVPAGFAGPRQLPTYPTLYVKYTMNCTFTIHNDDGARVSSIAPGTYQIEVSTPIMFKLVVPGGVGVDHIAPNDFTGCKGWVQFQLTGPGVDLFTTLDSGCDAFLLLPATTFRAGSTYVAQDLWQPGVTRTLLTTTSSGEPTAPVSPYTPTSGKGHVSVDVVGSAVKAAVTRIRSTLAGTLTGTGKPKLTVNGKAVSTLKAGRYKFVVIDLDPKRSFALRSTIGKATALTGVKFVGKRAVTVTLKAGQWMYYAERGKPTFFRVTN